MNYLLNFYSMSLDRVRLIFEQDIDPRYEYHNLRHTLDVLVKAEEIGIAEELTPHELMLIKIAALYHDTGFAIGRKNHEEFSIQKFLESASDSNLSESEIDIISRCILATRMPQNPKSHMEKVICDADLDYLGRTDFFEIGDTLRKEMLYAGELLDESRWDDLQLNFLENHTYKTNFSIQNRKQGLAENLRLLNSRLQHRNNCGNL
jgi:predicted metal-dependent HD superfamily phosphohydrolase